MTIETAICGRCGDRVPLDVNHGEVMLELVWLDDRNQRDDYVLCLDCASKIREEWDTPV
jgi:DNA-directed RNA polymerase subunit RPC12/RpoP